MFYCPNYKSVNGYIFERMTYLLKVGLTQKLPEHVYNRVREDLFDQCFEGLGLLTLGQSEKFFNFGL